MNSEARQLLKAEREVLSRLNAATEAVTEAEKRLADTLAAGHDTAAARRVLHESRRLMAAAQKTLAGIKQRQREIAHEAIAAHARKFQQAADVQLATTLSNFPLPTFGEFPCRP